MPKSHLVLCPTTGGAQDKLVLPLSKGVRDLHGFGAGWLLPLVSMASAVSGPMRAHGQDVLACNVQIMAKVQTLSPEPQALRVSTVDKEVSSMWPVTNVHADHQPQQDMCSAAICMFSLQCLCAHWIQSKACGVAPAPNHPPVNAGEPAECW